MHPLIIISKRIGLPKRFWQENCHKKAGQVEPFSKNVKELKEKNEKVDYHLSWP